MGIFDSGVGGLTVAHAIQNQLPDEQIIYFGDTFHLPYGDKSRDSVQYYSTRIADFLLGYNCKVLLIACNTASASAYEQVTQHVGDRAVVFNVIDPVVQYLSASQVKGTVGVIGTKGTINSGTYQTKLGEEIPGLEVVALSTPLLVPMIEEGFIYDDISNAIIRAYLSHPSLKGINTLILGCTHYPIIKRQIEKFFNFEVEIIDSGQMVAVPVREYLQSNGLMRSRGSPVHKFFVSDYTEYFEKISRMFFEENIHLEQINIWK
ncbi:MAG: glutamate racemase [Bacteroides sp. SM23_62_1]|nr:MAG: glutamate racemase [Bacteroides sp. SM23_62_1]